MKNNNLVKNFWEIVRGNKNDLQQLATRVGFGEGLLLLGKQNENVVALCADLTDSTQVEKFKNAYPERYFEMGVSEQNMASVASGMAAMGKVPFMASYAMFSPGRNWEQIRTTVVYNNVPVKIIGAHAGVSVGPDGGTHQALEDVGLMRMISGTVVIVPCDAVEAKKATIQIADNGRPTYLRLFREKSPVITDEESYFEVGKANIMYEGEKEQNKKIGIIACGEMVARSLFCVPELESLGYQVGVMNLHTIKPIDVNSLREFVVRYLNILTVEEHQIAGGMGSVILECLAKANSLQNLNIQMLGIDDRFGQSGTKEELFEEYKINEKHILEKIKQILK